MDRFRILIALVLAGLLRLACAQEIVAVPTLTSPVMDQAHMLADKQRQILNQVLTDYATRTGSQIAILLVSSTAPEAIEQYGIRVADAWKLGRKGVDDGVILIVAKDNPRALRRLRIEAGRGVQGSLTDAKSKRILEDVIAPHFRQDDYYGGLAAGISALTAVLDQEPLPVVQPQATARTDEGFHPLIPLLFLLVAVMLVAVSRRRRRSRLNHNAWGNAAGVIIGSILSDVGRSHGGFGGGFGSAGDSGMRGGGGGFDGGGASGDW